MRATGNDFGISLPGTKRTEGVLAAGWAALLAVLRTREFTRYFLAALITGVCVTALGMYLRLFPLWAATLLVLIGLLPAALVKWRNDFKRFGFVAMLLGALITVQGLHTIEHLIQWAQYHVLFWTMRQSNGLLSPANAEVVHFVWNSSVFIVVAVLLSKGVRNPMAWLLLFVTAFHMVEHSYTFIRQLSTLAELRALGVTNLTAQGLPGIVGRDGWLARSAFTQGTFLCSLPGLTTAIRLDVHFYWNALEMLLLIPAAIVHLGQPERAAPPN